ncbi:MAG TPA: chromosomal replication initiator protein DnaA [Solirubrobacteraceae bacterium]|nr:chromosomal replication initiator protein DnaA [Solirubrobacteraceae bacterium]
MSQQLEHIWSRVQAQLALVVDEPTYRIWLEPLRAVELDDQRLVLDAPPHARSWIRERFGRVIQASVELVLGPDVSVEITAADQPPDECTVDAGRSRPHAAQPPVSASRARSRPAALGPAAPLANPKLTFDQFVIGDCNRLAHAAALTVAEMPAQAYNPLFICGPPGVGKTHLLSSIANLLLAHNPGLTVRCTTGEAFTNEFLGALGGGGGTETFKLHFRDVDVLLLDDVQFLERKTKTEEEFFHTFNALNDAGRQIVLSSDRPPRDLQALEDRLRERFEAGLVADIKSPELATRIAILRKRAQHDNVQLADTQVLDVIAERITSNVRALEGALIRIVAFSSLTGRALTAELAREVLDSLYPRSAAPAQRTRTIAEIQAAACEHFGLSSDELLSSARVARVAWPRQVAMYLARELTGQSLPAIGREFGGRDHTTVLHACRRTTARIADDETSREAVEKLCRALGHSPS